MRLRKILFWVHFGADSIAGVIILVMSVTGLLLAYERQMTMWADRSGIAISQRTGTQRLPIETLIERAGTGDSRSPASLTVRADPSAPAEFTYGRDRMVLVDPYTGKVLGEGSQPVRRFFRVVEDWHRWLGMSGEGRGIGRAVTGACNLAFLVLVCSGLYIWWPRSLSWERFRSALRPQWKLSSRARDWNWHTVFGFWTCVPLFLIVISAVVMSYPWANNLLFRMTGNEPPAARGPVQAPLPVATDSSASSPNLAGLDLLLVRAEQQVPDWKSITVRLPVAANEPVSFAIDRGNGGRPDLRSQLTLDWNTGSVVRQQTFTDNNMGQKLRAWLRWVHTGEAGGWVGQAVGALACAAGIVLVYTGTALAWRRILSWRRRPVAIQPKQEKACCEETQLATGSSLTVRTDLHIVSSYERQEPSELERQEK